MDFFILIGILLVVTKSIILGLWLLFLAKSTYSNNGLNQALGKALFNRIWVSSPSTVKNAAGLGPFYNASRCNACHLNGGGGILKSKDNNKKVQPSLILKLSPPNHIYGNQIQPKSLLGIQPEANIELKLSSELIHGIKKHKPIFELTNLNYGKISKKTELSPRIAPRLYNLIHIEKAPIEFFLENHDPDDKNNDGISGEISYVKNVTSGRNEIGRYGWKASHPTLVQQIAGAFSNDMSLSTSIYPGAAGDCTNKQNICLEYSKSIEPLTIEVSNKVLSFIAKHTENIGRADYKSRYDSDILQHRGFKLFKSLKCSSCHVPFYQKKNQKYLAKVYIFTDGLTHDMGVGLADKQMDGKLGNSEWKTPSLAGIGYFLSKNSRQNYLHDGRANTVSDAIQWHGGEGKYSAQKYNSLSNTEKEILLEFVKSL